MMEEFGELRLRRGRRSGLGRAQCCPPCCERATLAFLVVLMLICALLQAVIITLRVRGRRTLLFSDSGFSGFLSILGSPLGSPVERAAVQLSVAGHQLYLALVSGAAIVMGSCPPSPSASLESSEGMRTTREPEDGRATPTSESQSADDDPSLRCPQEWIYIHPKCYHFTQTKTSQSESEPTCTSRGSTLASAPATLISLRRIITLSGREFWVKFQKLDNSWSTETPKGSWPDGTTESVLGRVGSCVKLGQSLELENCYSELPCICERDLAETRG